MARQDPIFWPRVALVLLMAAPAFVGGVAPGPAVAQSAITVNSTDDTTDGTCDATHCTLREAILEANDKPDPSTIAFDIPGSGVRTIRLESTLPAITERVTIDGYSQPGTKRNTARTGTNARLLVEIDVNSNGDGLFIDADDSIVRGLVINRANDGIFVAADDVTIAGNFIGTDATGTLDRGNASDGVAINAGNRLVVGGRARADRNLISGNADAGIRVFAGDSTIQNNLVGTDRAGKTAIPNADEGVAVGASDVSIERNQIAFNGQEGVEVVGAGVAGVSILTNAVFANNDDGLAPAIAIQAGANDGLEPPVVDVAQRKRGRVRIAGTIAGPPNQSFRVQVFANADAEVAEGTTFLLERTVTTDGTGQAAFAARIPKAKVKRIKPGQGITATATNLASGSSSTFSEPRLVINPGAV